MRLAIKRRSVSNWVSPGPRSPMPPFCRSRWVQPRTSRVARCDSCASSTCSLPSKLRARWAKISKIKPLRSNTRRPVSFSRLRSWLGRQRLIDQYQIRTVAPPRRRVFPRPCRIRRSTWDPDALGSPARRPTPTVPAEAANAANSAMSLGSTGCPMPTPTKTARSPPRGRSNNCRAPPTHSTIAGSVTSPSSPVGNRTLRAGTTVEMACL